MVNAGGVFGFSCQINDETAEAPQDGDQDYQHDADGRICSDSDVSIVGDAGGAGEEM